MVKYISESLRRFPKVRELIKLGYQFGNIIAHKLVRGDQMTNTQAICLNGEKKTQYMFGYYDKSPWDFNGHTMLTLQIPFSDKHPDAQPATICLYNTLNGDIQEIAETLAWNLQQGCMLQWIGPDYSDRIIYNDFRNSEHCSVIYDINRRKEKVISMPIYSMSKDGQKALSLNFSRLHRLRPGYGYSNLVDPTEGLFHPKHDGIWIIDVHHNESNLIISLDDIVNFNWSADMDGAEHKFNHLEFNPSGTRFMFLHRWRKNNIGYSRLFTANLDGTGLYCLADDQMVSHSCWKNDEEILCWARRRNEGDHYFCFTDETPDFKMIGGGQLDTDGHPSFSPCGRYILTDTYPDRFRMSSLVVWDTQEKRKHCLGRFYAPFKYSGEIRCDLHPRWSRDGKMICFDSVHEGNRQQYIIDFQLNHSES